MELSERYVMRTYGRLPLALVRGEGTYVWDADGNKYLDFVAGIAVNSLGHCHPKVVAAVQKQAGILMHCSNLYYIEPQARLARLLVENSACDRVFFCNSGAEANEAAIKLARKYAKAQLGDDCKYEIITALNSFHGRTLAAITATGQPKYQKGFEPLLAGFKYVPFNDLKALEEAVDDRTCAVMLEPLQGEGGVNVASEAYLQGVRALCDRHNLLLILDEVQCGLGRTGKLFAYEHYGIEPDIITLAKALGGGFPIGAMLAKERVAAAFSPGDHATTFGGNPLACAAGLAVVETLLQDGLPDNAVRVGRYFKERLEALLPRYEFAQEVRGKGLMLGMQLRIPGASIERRCRERGLLINCVGGNVLRFVPPLVITEAEVDRALEILEAVLSEESEGK
ncbi:MAG: acetylornithine transaminase [Peptococcaceae bacterium]|nr:acetylornithine transaminase [Peptococcaceae bacterium]